MNEPAQVLFLVKGFSMWPFLRDGQKLLVKKVPPAGFNRGDLVLYRSGEQLVCHRLLRKEISNGSWFFYCRGDASPGGPEQVSENMLVGKATAILAGKKAVDLASRGQRLRAMTIVSLLAPLVAGLFKIYPKRKII